jgi:hypothetical protein
MGALFSNAGRGPRDLDSSRTGMDVPPEPWFVLGRGRRMFLLPELGRPDGHG